MTSERLSKEEVETRRAFVTKNMCDLMKAIGRDEEFQSPDEWLDSIVERPLRRKAGQRNSKQD